MDFTPDAQTGSFAAIVVLIGTNIIAWYRTFRKTNTEDRKANSDLTDEDDTRTSKRWQRLVDRGEKKSAEEREEFRKEIQFLEEKVDDLYQKNRECDRVTARQEVQIQYLKQELNRLREDLHLPAVEMFGLDSGGKIELTSPSKIINRIVTEQDEIDFKKRQKFFEDNQDSSNL